MRETLLGMKTFACHLEDLQRMSVGGHRRVPFVALSDCQAHDDTSLVFPILVFSYSELKLIDSDQEDQQMEGKLTLY